MNRLDESLQELMALGKKQGHLTISQVNAYLPDEAVNPEKLDALIEVLEETGMEIMPEIHRYTPKATRKRRV